jgi:hypothetical protein
MQAQQALSGSDGPNVTKAFTDFLKKTVNLDGDEVSTARSSRAWLFKQIAGFQSDPTFPKSYSEHDIAYGSFARRTKKRPLDDIDQMICLSAQGSTYDPFSLPYRITIHQDSNLHDLCHDGTTYLNSTKVINKLIQKLAGVPQYSKADLKRNGVAAVLSLTSYDWCFDIVPCFVTTVESDGRTYYLIPDGTGHWMKTDPRIDKERVTQINQSHDGNVLNVIRVIKYWNRRPTMPSISSYLLELMILDYYASRTEIASSYVDLEIPSILDHIAFAIHGSVTDAQGIKGNLNDLSWEDRQKISDRAKQDAAKAHEARRLETEGDQAGSLKKWAEIFGSGFPA